MKIAQPLTAFTFAALLATTGSLYAAGDHAHGHDDDHGKSSMKHDDHGSGHDDGHGHDDEHGHDDHGSAMGEIFLKERIIDGYKVTFHITKAKPGKEMGGSHNFMIKVEKDGEVLNNIKMNTKVVHPNSKAETKKTMKMGDWLMAGYDLGHKGKHQMMILFKTADGEKHKGGIFYQGK